MFFTLFGYLVFVCVCGGVSLYLLMQFCTLFTSKIEVSVIHFLDIVTIHK